MNNRNSLNTHADELYNLLGKSDAIANVRRMISKVLHSDITVLITGETGTGKELVARALHDYGPRRTQPFIVQNCAGLPDSLLESELFGYQKGAFTGANQNYPGLFKGAEGGTLFLDELGEMSLIMQAKLLRALQNKSIRPLGSLKEYKVNVRVITATHQNLHRKMNDRTFRSDLYYRLAEFPIHLPPLHERNQDWKILAVRFLNEFSGKEKILDNYLSVSAITFLDHYNFPGNVRELRAMLRRALLLTEHNDLIEIGHLQPEGENENHCYSDSVVRFSPEFSLTRQLNAIEAKWIKQALSLNNGNQCQTAQMLGLTRSALIYRLNKLKNSLCTD